MKTIPKQLQNPNFRFIMVKKRDKKPAQKTWSLENSYQWNDTELQDWINMGGNYGLINASANLVVIDADSKKISDVIKDKLPKTFMVKTHDKRRHLYYYVKNCTILGKPELENSQGEALGDVRGYKKEDGEVTNYYVLCVGSTHPTGQVYEIANKDKNQEITNIKNELLLETLKPYFKKEGDKEEFKLTTEGKPVNFRHADLLKTANYMFRLGNNAEIVKNTLMQKTTNHLEPRITEKEINDMVRDAEKFSKKKKRTREEKDNIKRWGEISEKLKDANKELYTFFERLKCEPEDKLEVIDNLIHINDILKFQQPDILELIKQDMDKEHVGDSELKKYGFLTAISSFLTEKYRNSLAISGGSSEGKTNLLETIRARIPLHLYKYYSRVTTPVLEEELSKYNLIFFNEFKDDTKKAKEIIETVKTAIEDKTSTSKKVKVNGKWETQEYTGERASGIFTTTKTSDDEELNTRFATATVTGEPNKYAEIGKHIKKTYSSITDIIESLQLKETKNWVVRGLTLLNKDFDAIVIPYGDLIKNRVDKARSNRDLKRFLNLICASAFLHQLQREVIEKGGYKILVADIKDYDIAYEVGNRIYRETYTTVNELTKETIRVINKLIKDGKAVNIDANLNSSDLLQKQWVSSIDVRAKLGDMSRQTFYTRSKQLENNGFILIRTLLGMQITYIALTEMGRNVIDTNLGQKTLSLKTPFLQSTPTQLREKIEKNNRQIKTEGKKMRNLTVGV